MDVKWVQAALTDSMRSKEYRGHPNPLAGHCYVASEALYHLLGGRKAGLVPASIRLPGQSRPHWFLRDQAGNVIDPTAGQFSFPVPYHQATGRGFLTRWPSRRAKIVMNRALALEALDLIRPRKEQS